MLKQHHYDKIATDFQTDMGFMDWDGGPLYPYYSISKMPDDMKVVILTNYIIKEGIYQQVHRELYRLKNKIGKRRIKESTLYEKAINNVVDKV